MEESKVGTAPFPPDYTQNCDYMGQNLKDLPLPHVRMFPNAANRKREVELRLMSWVGTTAIGAMHVWVDFTPETNPVWNHIENRWQQFWDDETGKQVSRESGEFLHHSSKLYTDVLGYVTRTIENRYPSDKFIIHSGGIPIEDISAFVREQLELLDCVDLD